MNLCVCAILALATTLRGADALHIPLLVKYHQESHAAAGFLAGLGMQYVLKDEDIHPVGKFILVTGTALALGAAKEAFLDKHARRSEIPPWGWGAALSFAINVRF